MEIVFFVYEFPPYVVAKFVTILLEDGELRKRCGENARRRVLSYLAGVKYLKTLLESTTKWYKARIFVS